MKVWITKYALTKGIIEADGVHTTQGVYIANSGLNTDWFYGSDWHSNKQSAIKKAEEMCQKKIESLKSQIKKFEEMRFE